MHREVDAVERDLPVAKAVTKSRTSSVRDDVALLLDDALGKVAAQHLAGVDANGVAVRQRREVSHRHVADEDRAIGLQDLEFADAIFVVAEILSSTSPPVPGESRMSSSSSRTGLFETR